MPVTQNLKMIMNNRMLFMEEGMNQTKKLIYNAFMKLYDKQEYEKITVKELCATIPIARTTFYSYYDNIDDVKNEIEDYMIQGLLEVTEQVSHGNISEMDFMKFLDATQVYIEANRKWIYIFLVKQINNRFVDKWKNAICENFKKRYPEKQNHQNYELISEVVASATIGAYTYWLRFPNKVEKEDMKKIIKKALDAVVQVI